MAIPELPTTSHWNLPRPDPVPFGTALPKIICLGSRVPFGFLSFPSVCQEQQPVKVASGLAWKAHQRQSPHKKAFHAIGPAFLIHRAACGVLCWPGDRYPHVCPVVVNGQREREEERHFHPHDPPQHLDQYAGLSLSSCAVHIQLPGTEVAKVWSNRTV